MTEAVQGNWDKDFADDPNNGDGNNNNNNNNNFPKTEYMKMDKAGTYKIRLVGPYVKFRKHFKPYRATVQDSEKDIDPAWVAGFWPQERFAINVIDRADGKLKILEKPKSLFKLFHAYKIATNNDPTGKEGPDWSVTVKIPKDKNGAPDKLKTEYTATHLDKTPFTKEEMKLIYKHDESGNPIKGEDGKRVSGLWPLKKIYKSTSAEAMKKMWDELPADKKIPPKPKAKDESKKEPAVSDNSGAEPIEEHMEDSPADSNDMFDEKNGKENQTDSNSDNSAELF